MFKTLKKQVCTSILFIIFSSFIFNSFAFSNALKYSQMGTAALKLPLAITANYFDLKNNEKLSLIFDSLYCATDITDLILKACHSGNADEMIPSPIEIGFAVYHVVKLLNNIKELSKPASEQILEDKESLSSNQNNNNPTVPNPSKTILTIIKYIALTGDSTCSFLFGACSGSNTAARRKNSFLSLFSWNSGFAKTLNALIDNKKTKVHSPPLATLTTLLAITYSYWNIHNMPPSGGGSNPPMSWNQQMLQEERERRRLREQEYERILAEEIRRQEDRYRIQREWGEQTAIRERQLRIQLAEERRQRQQRQQNEQRRQQNLRRQNASLDEILQQNDNLIDLDQLYNALEREREDDCSICQDNFANNILITRCNHVFCSGCLQQWDRAKQQENHNLGYHLNQRPATPCPNCRNPVDINNVRRVALVNEEE